ncbi:hypothetical protein WA026_021600 [Henosepilachna vigintioctopunctata]|uniref:EF-hand domain-containing protein n=1 Tax=Henosepilachna vigintioctopunctata TaxID=420089 RepID=A0AAW1UV39_9CUCU
MAFSIFINSRRLSRSLIEKRQLFTVNIKDVKKDFISNMYRSCVCATPILDLRVTPQTSLVSRQFAKQANTKHGSKYSSESESDSDLDEPGHRGESDFWRRKIRTFHNIIDVNKDGVISFNDFELLIERFVALGNLTEKHTQEFKELIKEWWIKRWGEINPYNLVTVEKYLEYMHHVLNDRKLVRRAHSFIPYIFRAIDKDQSGSITFEEYKLFFECLGLPEKDAILAFRAIDSNGDGKITIKEFVKHGRDFFVTEDENRISKYFWGPLVP